MIYQFQYGRHLKDGRDESSQNITFYLKMAADELNRLFW